jgi:GR25 family glycosyltransferase involved in LPS biosynthesis
MKLNKKLVQTIMYAVLVFILMGTIYVAYTFVKPLPSIPIIHDVHIINLDKSKDRWSNLQPQLKKLVPLPCIRWSATDGRKLSEEQMLEEGIPPTMLPSIDTTQPNKEGRKGEIGCYLSHRKLLEHLTTLNVDPDVGHLILEDDVIIDTTLLTSWNTSYKYLPKDWGLFYFGLRENAELGPAKYGIAKLKKTWGTYGYMVKHSKIPEILRTIQPMTGPIDAILQDNYTKLHAYAFVTPKIYQHGDSKSTIWDGA